MKTIARDLESPDHNLALFLMLAEHEVQHYAETFDGERASVRFHDFWKAVCKHGGIKYSAIYPSRGEPMFGENTYEVLVAATLFGVKAAKAAMFGLKPSKAGMDTVRGLVAGAKALREEAETLCKFHHGVEWRHYMRAATVLSGATSRHGAHYRPVDGLRKPAQVPAWGVEAPLESLSGPDLFARVLGGDRWAWGIWYDGEDDGSTVAKGDRKGKAAEKKVQKLVRDTVDAVACEVNTARPTAVVLSELEDNARLATFIEVYCNPARMDGAPAVWRSEIGVMARCFGTSASKLVKVLNRNRKAA